jgi:type IV pilus assembly protein PilX
MRRFPNGNRQRGVVLFVGLIMLLLLTLIGITAMQVTLLQERMAGNFRIQHQAFEATEGLLKTTRTTLNGDANTSGPLYYSPDATLNAASKPSWDVWLTTEPAAPATLVNAHISVGSPPAVIGAHILKYFVVSTLQQDPGLQGGDAKAAVQAVFIY